HGQACNYRCVGYRGIPRRYRRSESAGGVAGRHLPHLDEQSLRRGGCILRGVWLPDHALTAQAIRPAGAGATAGVLGGAGAAAIAGRSVGDRGSIAGDLAAVTPVAVDVRNEGKPGGDVLYGELAAGVELGGLSGARQSAEPGATLLGAVGAGAILCALAIRGHAGAVSEFTFGTEPTTGAIADLRQCVHSLARVFHHPYRGESDFCLFQLLCPGLAVRTRGACRHHAMDNGQW